MDCDARRAKVTALKEKGTQGDPAKLPHKEEKLALTESSLKSLTEECYNEMSAWEERRYTELPKLLNEFSKVSWRCKRKRGILKLN